ncbi:hypothetical protein OC834_005679 [Tilletia horrida]|nr:hypothetical protein OC834_005679 [Tilletia horrida]KAK0534797.1 hypothetical protein OC835_002570 [Tilletia horrida]
MSFSKVVYKPDTQSTDSYIVIVNPLEFKKWSDGAFDVFHTNQGAQGHLNRASKQQLDAVFGSTNDTDCVTQVLEKGVLQQSAAGEKYTTTNAGQQGHNVRSRGSAGTGGR